VAVVAPPEMCKNPSKAEASTSRPPLSWTSVPDVMSEAAIVTSPVSKLTLSGITQTWSSCLMSNKVLGAYVSEPVIIRLNSGSISYSTTVSAALTSGKYALYIFTERMN